MLAPASSSEAPESQPKVQDGSALTLRDRVAAAIKRADEAVYEDEDEHGADPFLRPRPASYDHLADAGDRGP